MDMNHKVTTESLRDGQRQLPLAVCNGMRRPADQAKSSWALRYRDGFATREPMLRRGFLKMADILVPFFIAEQPSQAEGWLKGAVDDRGPSVSTAFACEATRDVCVLG